ncbi:MAG: copper amine oxidase [Firmicutes bacterium]|nr:copper amine oxidase [Bacillota bacterium]
MKRFDKVKFFVLGMVVMVIITAFVPAFAANTTKQISATYANIKIYVDDLLISPKDGLGNSVEPFIYQGTTYLPVRAVSEALGKPILWDGKTNSIYIGKHDSDEPAISLNDLDYFNATGSWDKVDNPRDNLGNSYVEGLSGINSLSRYADYYATVDYVLNGKYRRLKGSYILRYIDRSKQRAEGKLKIYGDDKLLFSDGMKPGKTPVEFDIDLSGVLRLRIEMSNYDTYSTIIADANLYQ